MTTKMLTLTRLGMAGLLGLLPGLAVSQTMNFTQVDADGNGTLGMTELTTAFGTEGAARVLASQDANGDGMLSRAEASSQSTGTMSDGADNGADSGSNDVRGSDAGDDGGSSDGTAGSGAGGSSGGDPLPGGNGTSN